MKYLMLHCFNEADFDFGDGVDVHTPESAAEEAAVGAWDAEMLERGILVGGGRLRPTGEATTLRVRDGQVLLTDGPFAETKEQIAGYAVLECADLDEAIEVASRHPAALIGTFELRPFWE